MQLELEYGVRRGRSSAPCENYWSGPAIGVVWVIRWDEAGKRGHDVLDFERTRRCSGAKRTSGYAEKLLRTELEVEGRCGGIAAQIPIAGRNGHQ